MASRAAGGKKLVQQGDLRRLMRQREQQQQQQQQRVESPHARYNSRGQLSCALCNTVLKSHILWHAHILGKQHKDKVSELKGGQQGAGGGPHTAHTHTRKRTAAQPEVQEGKKPKASGDQAQGGPSAPGGPGTGLGLLAGQYDDDDDDDDGGPSPQKQAVPPTEGLPADFFDSSVPGVVSHSGSVPRAEPEKKDTVAEALPEGFFDDPVRDAKVRNVDTPKDHMDKEWEEFQKEMRQVSSASEAIVAEEDEEGRLERQIDEIDEQMECLRRVEVLRTKQEAVRDRAKVEEARRRTQEDERRGSGSGGEEEEEEDEEELMNVLGRDWRAKGALA